MVRFSFDPEKGKKSVSLMGVVNLSPDSFYAGSRCPSGDEAVRLAERHVEEGADLLDVGAESSRPGARPIPEKAELDLLLPTVSRLCKKYPVPVSVDTYKPRVAAAVLQEGASAINDITGLRNPEMGNIIARAQAGVVVMHMQGTPPTMQIRPAYHHLVEEIIAFLEKSVQTAREAGIAPDRIAVDPGFGFGKTFEHNLELLQRLEDFQGLNQPVLVGISRKSFVGKILNHSVEDRLEGSLAAAVISVLKGARWIRTHDVGATRRAVELARAVRDFQKED